MNNILLAPTTLPDTPPLDYIAAATVAGYDGMALRVHASPGLPFHPLLGNAPLIRDIKHALTGAPPVWEIGSFYLQPATQVSAFESALSLGAQFGAKTAFVIGDDPDWARLRDSFGKFCDLAARFKLSAFVEFVPQRPLGTLAATLKLFAESGRTNVAVCVDPLNFARSGGKISEITAIDRKYLPYAQFSDGVVYADELAPSPRMRPNARRLPGDGDVPLWDIIAALPANIALSVEFPQSRSAGLPGAKGEMSPTDWAKFVLSRSRQYLARRG
ncbi:MAG: sugar phosphate isomerase/epimerase family protein [Xanthobacteraceae bacterium]